MTAENGTKSIIAELESLSHLDPELQKLLDSTGPWPDPPFTDVAQCRNISDYADGLLVSALGAPSASIEEQDLTVPLSEGRSVTAVLTRPSQPSSSPPGSLVVLYHPGGFFLGNPKKLTPYARALASYFGASVLCPTYALAPESPFPAAIDDAWKTLLWASTHAKDELCAAPESRGFIVGGVSSGANFAAVLVRRAVEEGLSPSVTGVWTAIPMMMTTVKDVPARYREQWLSRGQNRDALVIDQGKLDTIYAHYRPDGKSPLFNPLAHEGSSMLSRMPRTFVQVAGADLVRDDGLVFAQALKEAGAQVHLKVYPGLTHSFWVFAPMLRASKTFIKDIMEGFAWLLGTDVGTLSSGWETSMATPEMKV